MLSEKQFTDKIADINRDAVKYRDTVDKFAQLVIKEGVALIKDREVQFGDTSINIDVIAFFPSSPIFFYVTNTNEKEDPEINKVKWCCEKANIKLVIYHTKENLDQIESVYQEIKNNLLSATNNTRLIVF